jgi:hypothetical protein
VPLLGGLVDCDGADHWEALGQTFVVLLLSTTPIWLAALIIYGSGNNRDYSAFKVAMRSTVANGELFMFCTALLAPILWVALVDLPRVQTFPNKASHMVLLAVTGLLAAALFALTSSKQLNPVFAIRASTYMFLFSVGLLYLGIAYHVSRVAKAATEFRRQEREFSDEMRRYRR